MVASLSALLFAALIGVMWLDLRARLIPNALTLPIALAAPLWWWANGWPLWPDAALQIAQGLVVFLLFAGLFALGAMGGGDVKLIAALALWLPFDGLVTLLVATAILGGFVTLATLLWHRLGKRPGAPEIPYGIAIALAALWVFTNQLLTTPSS